MKETDKEVESRLVPALREGIDVVKMIFFKKLKEMISAEYPDQAANAAKLSGAVINELFGTPNSEASFVAFCEENREPIESIIQKIPENMEEMRIPLTDALRTAVLCDRQEETDNSPVLARAKDLGVLLIEREMPMPHRFIELVRRLGSAYNILTPPMPEEKKG